MSDENERELNNMFVILIQKALNISRAYIKNEIKSKDIKSLIQIEINHTISAINQHYVKRPSKKTLETILQDTYLWCNSCQRKHSFLEHYGVVELAQKLLEEMGK